MGTPGTQIIQVVNCTVSCIIIFGLKCVNAKAQRIDVMERVILATATVSMKAAPFEKEPSNACQFRDFL